MPPSVAPRRDQGARPPVVRPEVHADGSRPQRIPTADAPYRTAQERPRAQVGRDGQVPHRPTIRPPDGPPMRPTRDAQARPVAAPRSGGHGAPPRKPAPRPTTAAPRRRRSLRRRLGTLLAAVLVFLVIFGVGSYAWVESRINHVDALSGAANTPGQTYLIVGSDSRAGWADDGTEGARTDTIMVLHKPANGPTALISIPRDSYVDIPGHDANKINAAYAFGGAPLLVQTIEQLTGLTVDRYVEVGFLGVQDVVNSLGGVELCYDTDVNDPYSTLVWQAGCHNADGATALAFSRMRHEDPLGDIGRTQRQQQVIAAVVKKAASPSILLNPFKAHDVATAALSNVAVSNGTHAYDLAVMALAFNAARGTDAVKGTPPIASIDYRVDGVGSCVLLDPDLSADFWIQIADGTYPAGTTVGGL